MNASISNAMRLTKASKTEEASRWWYQENEENTEDANETRRSECWEYKNNNVMCSNVIRFVFQQLLPFYHPPADEANALLLCCLLLNMDEGIMSNWIVARRVENFSIIHILFLGFQSISYHRILLIFCRTYVHNWIKCEKRGKELMATEIF